MLFSEMKKKEVINMRDCRRLGHVVDLEFDECNGCIKRIKVAEQLSFMHCIPCWPWDADYCIAFKEIKQIGPDIIVVDIC